MKNGTHGDVNIIILIIVYLFVLLLGTISFVSLTNLPMRESLVTTAIIEILSIVGVMILSGILEKIWKC